MKESNKHNLKKALNDELQSIRLSDSVKRDIHYNATHAQPPSNRKLLRYPALVAAALIIMLGASLLIAGHRTLPDTLQQRSTVLSQRIATETLSPKAKPESSDNSPTNAPAEFGETPTLSPMPTEMSIATETPPSTANPESSDNSPTNASEEFLETPTPSPMPTEMPMDASVEETLVWSAPGSLYYHLANDCSGLNNAEGMSESDAIDAGKYPCPVCTVVTEDVFVWCTEGSRYYHRVSDCSGMENATERTESEAIVAGKYPCPACAVITEDASVWSTTGGRYYHRVSDCSGMENAIEMGESHALKSGKSACPVCFDASSLTEATPLPTDDSSEAAMVWSTNGGAFYHLNSDCSGMENAHRMTLSDAIDAGKSACPTCFEASSTPEPTPLPTNDSSEAAMVWSTNGGAFYHLNSDCSGMENAHWMTLSDAIEAGKSACPVCIGHEDLNVSQTDADIVHAPVAESADDSVYDDIEALCLNARLSRYTLETSSFMVLDLNHDVNLRWLDAIENPSDWSQAEVSSDSIDFESELKDWLSLSDIESVQSTFEGNGAVGFEIVTITPMLNDVNTEFSSNADAAPQGREYRLRATENAADKCVLYVLDQAISDDTARITLNIRRQQWYYDGHTIYRRIAGNTVEEMEMTLLNGGTADIDEIPLEGLDASLTLFTTDENRFLIFETEGDSDLSESCLVMDNGESTPPDMVTNTTMHGEKMLIWRWDSRIASIHLTDGENTFDLPIPND